MPQVLENLFSPVRINKLALKNRAVMPAMGTGFGNRDGTASDRLIAYLGRRAQGGAGLIITEVVAMDPRGKGFPSELCAYDDRYIPGLKKIADEIHKHGAAAAVQLHHAGRETYSAVVGDLPEAPSSIPSALLNQPCAEMSIERIQAVVQGFASAAGRVKQAGFDAVEIHGAHGYLLTQFMSPFSNQRTDEYGGSDENRARFVLEVLAAVRKAVGPDFCVIIRVSAEEAIRGGYNLSFMKWLAPQMVAAGADAIHASIGVYTTPGNLSIAGFDTEAGFNLFRAAEVKKVVDVPVIGVGRVHDPRLADAAIARGDADLISFGRQHLADPDFLAKARKGDFDDIRFCLACNQGCIERLSFEMKSASCTVNPEVGQEYKPKPAREESPKRIHIIGAGPAGLEAALVAAERGHHVSIFERESEPGGQLRSASKPPHKEAFWQWVEWVMRRLDKLGVVVNLGSEMTEEMLRDDNPDMVVLASGALPARPDLHGINCENVCDARDLLLGKVEPKSPGVILGAGYVGMEAADFLIARKASVTIVEMKAHPPVLPMTAHGYWLNYYLRKSGGKLMLGTTVKRIEPNAVVVEKEGKEQILAPAPLVVTALGAASETSLEPVLQELGIPFVVLGDAKQPRRLIEAIHEGYGFLDSEI
jgi:2,4-dienoyl-CoA reductase-like NADH-dependent reductase (Old Yellow Enzyme family)